MSSTLTEKLTRLKYWVFLAPLWLSHGSPLKLDEELIFFPTSATQNEDGSWDVPVHAWFFELDTNSLIRLLNVKAVSELLEFMDVTEQQAKLPIFQERIKWFLLDNESNKRVNMRLGDELFPSPRTGLNGHTQYEIPFTGEVAAGEWLTLPVQAPDGDHRVFSAEAQMIPRQGLSVISDIDDTIKVSNVSDKKKLVQNIFFHEYTATKGMPAFYQWLENEGAYFHYLSSSPWQMYPLLQPFIDTHYPKGAMHLRNFNPTDRSFIKFFLSSEVYKTTKAMNIIHRYPEHQFILIGDSSEKDPEVYARIYREFPHNIKQILIRAVDSSNLHHTRFAEVFKDVPADKWKVFSEPSHSLVDLSPEAALES